MSREKTVKQKLAEICLYGGKEYVYAYDLQEMSDVEVSTEDYYESCCLYEAPEGADITYIPEDSSVPPVAINNFYGVATIGYHYILNSSSHIMSTLNIERELAELKKYDAELKRRDPALWQAKRDQYKEPSIEDLNELIADHFVGPSIEKVLAKMCVDRYKEPLIVRDDVQVIVNRGMATEKRMDVNHLDPKAFKQGTHITVQKSPDEDPVYLGVVDQVMEKYGMVAIELSAMLSSADRMLGAYNGTMLSNMDFTPEYDRLLEEKYPIL